jgi:16S rRNA (adenine1518-N6/adenine1519-N6)-dimethyltransferase
MDLTSPKFIKNLLKKYGIRPFKGWGQNFLVDRSVLRKIIESAELKKSDIVLEIGPGIGTLTQELAKKAKKVIAVEKDKKMVEILKETLKGIENVKVIQGDILKIPNSQFLIHNSYKIVANLPYYIVSPVIRKFLELKEVRPLEMILMVQKEVAQRICAKPPNMNLLAVSVQFYSKPEILFYVSKNSFWPRPKVDGALLKIIPLTNTNRKLTDTKLFFKIVKAGFCQPRKQLANNLAKMLKLDKKKVKNWLLENGIQPSQRAETLSVNDWLKLTKNFKWKKR